MISRRKKQPRTRMVSFVATLSILTALLAGTYAYIYLNSVPVRHLPSEVPAYEPIWGKYVPQSTIQVGFLNYTHLRQANSSLPFAATILRLSAPSVVLTSADAVYFETMVFEIPNSTLDIAFLTQAKFAAVSEEFEGVSGFGIKFGNDTLYAVQDVASGKPVLGWLGLIPEDRAVAFVAGLNDAKAILITALDVPNHASSSMADLLDVRQMLWVTGGAYHVSIGIQNFTGEISQSHKVLTTVDVSGQRVNVTRVVQFPDAATAYAQYGAVREGYKSATNVVVYDAFVRASQLDALSKLGGDYRLVL
ncbi:MAG: hypothetical protein HY297_01280 [Thaumarchaeota archaeon]|nr:hypothetical protein [Nitrososphaerota archaeon]